MLLLILSIFSLRAFPQTLARFSSEYSGSDRALIAKWNFKAGPDENNLENQDFTFDVFNAQTLTPGASGQNSFIISPGKSDVAIDYGIYMKAEVLKLGGEENKYLPIKFRINSSWEEDWFAPKDKSSLLDKDGYFLVASGKFDANESHGKTIKIDWSWDSSYYSSDNSYNANILNIIKSIGIDGNVSFKIEGKQVAPD